MAGKPMEQWRMADCKAKLDANEESRKTTVEDCWQGV